MWFYYDAIENIEEYDNDLKHKLVSFVEKLTKWSDEADI